MNKRLIKEVINWGIIIAISFLIAMFINKVIVFQAKIPSGSMENTILVGDRIATFRQSYLFSDPKRGDIIVFPFPDDESEDYIKRIIGLPGDTIEGKSGKIYINGEVLEEEYIKEEVDYEFGPYDIPEESYFVMGDNRNGSSDSREWENTYVNRDKIMGKALFKVPSFKKLK